MIVIITGPSATGKTALALQKAQEHNGELVNFDSRQIYKYLDIITGKDKPADNTKIWLYDVVDPKHYFSSFDFTQKAMTVISDIITRKKTPILVGGTYLYLYHLLYKVDTQHIKPNAMLRKTLNNQPVPVLQNKLQNIDKDLYDNLNQSDQQNPQRLIRKIEIASFYKKKGERVPTKIQFILNDFFKNKNIKIIGLSYQKRENLQKAIKIRVEKRLEQGAVEEVQNLLSKGYTAEDPGLQTIGYQQVIKYLNNQLTNEEMINEWTTKEIQYTKRQLTFMKKDPNIKWILI